MQVYYFAFGSNLSSPRLLERLPQASVAAVATLDRHLLCWRKNDRGQSGKCDIDYTGEAKDIVYGVVYRMTDAERGVLDGYESEGFGYERREVEVIALDGNAIEAFTYYALDIDHLQQPFHWYKEHVLRGAVEHDFPQHYVETIKSTPSIDDYDEDRHFRELSIYLDL